MPTMNISLPDAMKQYVEQQVADGGYSSASEYVRELVRADQRRRARAELEAALLEGLAGPREVATPDFWNSVREEAARLSTEGQAAPPKSYSFDL